MPPRVERSSTLAGRCGVTRMDSPFRTPKPWRRSRERRVRVPVHEDEIGLLPIEDVLETVHHLRRLAGVTGASDSEVVVRSRHVEDLEEHVGHVLVIVLARVDQNLLVVLADLPAHRRGFNELRACADDARDFHGRQSGRTAYNDIVPNDLLASWRR